MWIIFGLDLENILKNQIINISFQKTHYKITFKSLVIWTTESRIFGISYILKLLSFYLVGNNDEKQVINFLLKNLNFLF